MNATKLGKQLQPKRTGGAGLSGLEFYGLHDYKMLLFRRKWMLLTIALVIAVFISLGTYRFPNLYKASTTIVVDPGKVPDSYVKSTATLDANQRLVMLQEQILSTTRLGQVIDELGLYSGLRKTRTLEDVVTQMRRDIKIEPVVFGSAGKELQAFSISSTSRSATLAAKVANRLASSFIEENMKVREQQVLGTADFFDRELEKAKQDLDEKAKSIEQLRTHYASDLPESQNLNVQALTATQLRMTAETDATSRAQHQKVYLESLLADSPTVVDLDSNGNTGNTAGLEEQLQHLQEEMDQLNSRYGPQYPDVLSKAAEIHSIQEEIKKQEKLGTQEMKRPSTGGRRHNPVVESQIAQLADEVRQHEDRERELRSQVAYYESTLRQAPAVAQQLTAAANDYSNAADRYKRLEDHKFTAELSSDVETRQKGERFVILEPAQPPERAYAPNRPLIDALGLVLGLGLSLLLVVILEIMDATVKTQRELSEGINSPIFGEIPWLNTRSERRHRRIWTALAAGANVALVTGYVGLFAAALK